MTRHVDVGGGQWLAIQIATPGGGIVWIDPLEGATLLYGKNGSGKSTILSAVRSLLRGVSPANGDVRAFFRLRPTGSVLDPRRYLMEFADHITETEQFRPPLQPGLKGLLDIRFKIPGPSDAEQQSRSHVMRDELLRRLLEMVKSGLLPPDFDEASVDLFIDAERSHWVESSRQSFRWFLRGVSAAASRHLSARVGSYDDLKSVLSRFDIDIDSYSPNGQGPWERRDLADQDWLQLFPIWLVDALSDLTQLLDDPDGDYGAFVGPLAGYIGENFYQLVGMALKDVSFGEVVTIRPSGTDAEPLWSLCPAIHLEECHPASLKVLRALFGSSDESENPENLALAAWREIGNPSWVHFGVPYDNDRFASLPVGREIVLHDFPIDIVDLDEEVDVEQMLGERLGSSEFRSSESVLFTDSTVEVELPAVQRAQGRVEAIGRNVARLDLGLRGLRLRVRSGISDWMRGRPLALEALDAATLSWVGLSELSGAQQLWVRRSLLLGAHVSSIKPLIVLADEPENGIHQVAVAAAFDYLLSLDHAVLIATHHPRALAMPTAKLVGLTRTSDGIELSPPFLGQDVGGAAERLGVTPFDLLALKRLMVVVEGSHDEIVVNRMLGLSTNPALAARCLVAAVRGVSNVATVADSVILSQFTAMHILIVTDNTKSEPLQNLMEKCSVLLDEGRKPHEVRRASGLEGLQRDATYEERFVLDLIGRAVQNGMLSRVHVEGLSGRDIIEELPHASFGLDADWPTLRREHDDARKQGVPRDFKEWLREYKSARINNTVVGEAFDAQSRLSPSLAVILSEIEILADVAALG